MPLMGWKPIRSRSRSNASGDSCRPGSIAIATAGSKPWQTKPHTGKPCKLTPEEQQAFRQRILNGPTDADGQICTLRGPEAKRILEVEFGKKYHLGAVYALMHRLRLSPLRPASRHPKNDPKAMADWLERAPFLSRR